MGDKELIKQLLHRIKVLESLHYDPRELLGIGCLPKEVSPAFNGQISKQQIFQRIISEYKLAAVIETGTYTGLTTYYMSEQLPDTSIHTIELDRFSYLAAKARLECSANVTLYNDSSETAIKDVIRNLCPLNDSTIFWYLDAHWNPYCPLVDELLFISQLSCRNIIMIDDFLVADDLGYGYDSYEADDGSKMTLSLDYIIERNCQLGKLRYYYPLIKSSHDTGSRRGTVIVCSQDLEIETLGLRRPNV